MKKSLKLMAITMLAATTFTTSALAESRHQRETVPSRSDSRIARSISVEGRVTDIDRERNGIVIRIDNGRYTLWADSSLDVDARTRNGSRLRNLERGDYIRATGVVSERGIINVRDLDLLRDADRRNGRNDRNALLSGTVESYDERRNVLYVRDGRSRSVITVDVRNERLRDVRRGDRVTIRGGWERNGTFDAEKIDVDRAGNRRW
jgi:hypothetical protein